MLFRSRWVVASRDVIDKLHATPLKNKTLLACYETFALTPDNQLIFDAGGQPLLRSCGTGDAPAVLVATGEIERFLRGGGRKVVFLNLDELDREPDLTALLDAHDDAKKPITCSVESSTHSPGRGVICNHQGFDQAVEHHRLSFNGTNGQFTWRTGGVMIVDATALGEATFKWPWHRVRRIVGGKLMSHFERSIYDLTSIYQTQFVNVQ